MFYFFDEIPSTIDEARNEKYLHGDVVLTENQTAGRGQRGKKWDSERGKNLMFSVVLDTSFLRTDEQFLLLQTVALALVDTFKTYGLDARVKWTNDIYIGDRKIVGVLIDHSASGPNLSRSGVGIGINVNQIKFVGLPNATSMTLETGCEYDRGDILQNFYNNLMARFEDLKGGEREKLQREYHTKIYRLDTPALFVLPDGTEITGTIRGVKPTGELLVESGSEIKSYLYREIGFVI